MIQITRFTAPLADGRSSAVFRIAAEGGITVLVAELGATLLRIDAPDRLGRIANVILGDDDIARYPAAGGGGEDARFGASCGRVANRTAGASFTLDGACFALDANDGPNHLHGGADGFSSRLWHGEQVGDGVEMTLTSPDGDGGYPGALAVTARFALLSDNELAITYTATTDRPTHVNIVSHPYFNLSGDAADTVLDHQLAIHADSVVPIDGMALPLGSPRPVADTPFDFRRPRVVGDVIDADDPQIRVADGFNHCFVLRPGERPGSVRPAAWLRSPTGRTLTLFTDQPGLQFYSGNALSAADPAAGGLPFGRRTGLCLEAQGFPNAANRPDFPSTRLDPGEVYRSELRLRFGVHG